MHNVLHAASFNFTVSCHVLLTVIDYMNHISLDSITGDLLYIDYMASLIPIQSLRRKILPQHTT